MAISLLNANRCLQNQTQGTQRIKLLNAALFHHPFIQRQELRGLAGTPNGTSVQQVLQESLSVILRHETVITGAGRTDAGYMPAR